MRSPGLGFRTAERCCRDTSDEGGPSGGLPHPWRNVAISPSPQPPPAATRVVLTGRRFAGGGATVWRGRGLATDLIHQPTQGRRGLVSGGLVLGVRRFRRLGLRCESLV